MLGYNKTEPLEERSANQQDKLNKEILTKASDFLQKTFIPKIKEDLPKLINQNLQIIFEDGAVVIGYDNDYADESILRAICLEIGALAAWTPTQIATIRPYIAEAYLEHFSNAFVDVRTTTPGQTFWEKIAILHREAFHPENSSFPPRMSRHYYDIYRMTKLGILDRALQKPNLLSQVAEFKTKFYPQKWAHYELAKLGTLRLTPPDYNPKSLQCDYTVMAGMIYGEKPGFKELMLEIIKIEQRLNH